MQSVVRVNKWQLDYFRRLARATKLEISALMIGRVINPELTVIDKFVYPKAYHTQTTEEVRWFLDEYEKVRKQAVDEGLSIVGEIHSHPEWDAVLSKDDYKSHIESGSRISAICSILGRRTRVRFWIAESALPCKVEYVNQN
jgi:proteasome lid subunit RPN8/RPN11